MLSRCGIPYVYLCCVFQEQRAVDCGMLAGSISLVAPELRNNEAPSPATDMYAVGGLMLWVGSLIDKLLIMFVVLLEAIFGLLHAPVFSFMLLTTLEMWTVSNMAQCLDYSW